MEKQHNLVKNNIKFYFAMGLIMMGILLLICVVMHIVPFGENTFAIEDATYQYLDFFAYLKDVLNGDQYIEYNWGKTLGGNYIAVLAYYLCSPFNLLIVFFKKSQLHIFYTLLVVLKMSMAGVTCSVFLKNRFSDLKTGMVMLLSISYGLMQYNVEQAKNIMWLDGVYMLPLILLGVYRLVKYDRKLLLVISVALSILFNWYSGGINCLFAIAYFAYEVLLEKKAYADNGKTSYVSYVWKFFYTMLCGVLISCALFAPAVLEMLSGRGRVDSSNYAWGNCISLISGFVVGSSSSYHAVSLFCGSIPLIGMIAYCLSRSDNREEKRVDIAMLIVTMLFFYVPFFIFLFSLLKDVLSYWYRYSYIGIIMVVIIAAKFYQKNGGGNDRVVEKSVLLFAFLLLAIEFLNPKSNMALVYITIFAAITTTFLYLQVYKNKKTEWFLLLFLIVVVELCANLKVKNPLLNDANQYKEYVESEEKLIEALQEYDSDFYRINKTSNRRKDGINLSVNYNEAIAFDYNSICGYTSDPDNYQRIFLDKLGYNSCSENMNIVDTSIIGADSLLGVKYVLSQNDINGLQLLDIQSQNGKSVYYNPYVLPKAFTYTLTELDVNESERNPFEYQNQIYSLLGGEPLQIYKRVEYVRNDYGDSVVFELPLPEKTCALYGYCDITEWNNGSIYANGNS